MADGRVKIDIEADESKFESSVDDLGDKAKEGAQGMDELGDSAKKAGDEIGAADIVVGNFIANALTSLISGIGDAVGSMLELADTTREYREDMAKLETAFTTQGHSAETASQVYKDFYAILGESDRSVEAANHLAELTDNVQELEKWSNIAAGVTAKFGDSLPIEGLTEAANETAKVGEVTGPLADALVWAGISEEEFNKQLAECATEQERATLITETLNGLYSEAAEEYNKLTKSTQDAREATADMEAAQAEMGATLEPVTTAWTSFKAQALEALVPVVQSVIDAIKEAKQWLEENEQAATIITGVIIGLAAAFGVLAVALGIQALIQGVTTAITMLNGSLLANPIVLVVAAIAGLVAAFIYLWNNCDSFREFWITLWEGIKTAALAVSEWFTEAWAATSAWATEAWADVGTFFTDLWAGFQEGCSAVGEWFTEAWATTATWATEAWADVKQWFADLWTGITETAAELKANLETFFSEAWETVKGIWDNSNISSYFDAIWATIEGIFSVVESVLSGDFSGAWSAIQGIANQWSGFFSGVWSDIQGVFASVGSWFGEIFNSAYTAITGVWDSISGYFSGLYSDITGAFSNILSDFTSVGGNIISGIWAGISGGWDWLIGQAKSLANSLFEAAKEALGIASPSKRFKWIGEMSADGVGVGFDDALPDAEKQITRDLSGLTARVQSTVTAESGKMGQNMGRQETGFTELARAVGIQTAGINSLSAQYSRGTGNMRPVVLELNGRELGRTVVDVSAAEGSRVGTTLVLGGAL